MAPPMFDGKDRASYRDWAFKLELYIIDNTYDHGANIMTWAKECADEITEAKYDEAAAPRNW